MITQLHLLLLHMLIPMIMVNIMTMSIISLNIAVMMINWHLRMQYSLVPWHQIPEKSTICIQMGLRQMMLVMTMMMMPTVKM